MIESKHEQGTEGWLIDRSGIPTASEFSKILTAGGKPSTQSDQSDTYMNQLLAEYVVGGPVDQWEGNQYTDRGKELEQEARDTYVFVSGNEVRKVNLCFLDERKLIGASPDGLIDDNGLNEFKCPKASTLIGYILKDKLPTTYKPQIQGQLWVTGREWCDFMAYHPQLEPMIIRVNRDERYIKLLTEAVECFVDEMLEKREKLSGLMAR